MASIEETFALAVELYKAGRLRSAEERLRQVLDTNPDHVDALTVLGMLAYQADRPEQAIDYLGRALAIRPEVAETRSNLAAAYEAIGDAASAIGEYREAHRLKPTAAPICVNLGQALLNLGQADDARWAGLEALRLAPGYAPAYGLLGALATEGRYDFADADIDAMQRLVEESRLAAEHTVTLLLTLAGLWDRRGECDRAFDTYRRANDLQGEMFRRAGRPFDRPRHRAQVDRMIAAFTADFFARARSFGVPSQRPVFVVGMVRSGTSLVEQILTCHPGTVGCGELKDIDKISASFYSACTTGIEPATVNRLAMLYLDRLARIADRDGRGDVAVRAIDKMPHNYFHLGMIAVLFPNARVVHCRRDPMDTCVSAYLQNLVRLPYTASLEYLGFYYREYERLMAHWHHVLPLRIHSVQYEELVAAPERVTRELVAFCDLAWDDRCLASHQNPRPVQTASRLQVRQPIYKHAVARWKRFEAHLQPLRDALAGN